MLCWLDIYVEFVSKKKFILLSLKHFHERKKLNFFLDANSKYISELNPTTTTTAKLLYYYIFCFLLMFFLFFSVFFLNFWIFSKIQKNIFFSLVYLLGYDATLSSACCTLALASILLLVTAYLSATSWPARSRAAE